MVTISNNLDSTNDKMLRKQHYQHIKKLCARYRLGIVVGSILRTGMSLLTVVNVLFLQNIINNVTQGESGNLVMDVLIVFGMLVLYALVQYVLNYNFGAIFYKCGNVVRRWMYNNYLEDNSLNQYTSSEILSRIYEESPSVTQGVLAVKMQLICPMIEMLLYVGIIFYFAWVVGIVAIVVLPLMLWTIKLIAAWHAKQSLEYTKQSSETRGVVLQGIAGSSILRLLSQTGYYRKVLDKSLDNETRAVLKQAKSNSVYQSFASISVASLPMIFAALTALLYSKGIVQGVGTIMLVYLLIGFLNISFNNISNVSQILEHSNKAYTRIAPLMEESKDNFGDKVLDGDIHTVDISIEGYAYDEDKSILQGFGLSLRAGDSVCVVGESGSGKSTLLKLLLNQIRSDTARIQINGNNLKDIERESYYRQVGYVQQKSFMFRGSVIDNITLGDSYTQEEIDRVLQECGLREFVEEYGLGKEIDEKNENVSGGQLQRISLARTLIRKPRLILLDEPTASLDSETGVDIVKTLLHRVERDNLILLCVSHDKSVIELFGKTVQIG